MNENKTELMIAVERAVRPVRASAGRKMRMRQELLGHLSASFEEARSRLNEEPAAVAEALSRLGPTAELTAELQRSCGWPERALCAAEEWVQRGQQPSAVRLACRAAAGLLMLISFPVGIVGLAILGAEGFGRATLTYLALAAVFVLISGVNAFVFVWLMLRLRDALVSGKRRARAIVGALALAALTIAASGTAFAFLGIGPPALERLPHSGAAAVVAAALVLGAGWLLAVAKRQTAEWAALRIEA